LAELESSYKYGDWNHVTIVTQSNRVRAWLNGRLQFDCTDEAYRHRAGFLALKLFSNRSRAVTARFRDIRLKRLTIGSESRQQESTAASEPGFTSLFNGRDLTGWMVDKNCTVRDDAVSVTGNQTGGSIVWTNELVHNFELRLRCRFADGAQLKGGYFQLIFRGRGSFTTNAASRAQAYYTELNTQADRHGAILQRPPAGSTGYVVLAQPSQRRTIRIGEPRQQATVVEHVSSPTDVANSLKANDWNDVTILADGAHIKVTINNVTTAELFDEDYESSFPGGGVIKLSAKSDFGDDFHGRLETSASSGLRSQDNKRFRSPQAKERTRRMQINPGPTAWECGSSPSLARKSSSASGKPACPTSRRL
jgi:hypothetical protein